MAALFGWSGTAFDKLLEKATSHMQLEPDWDAILQLCDCIRQGDVQPKYALSSIKKKLYAPNPHVVLYALQVLESCVKNCGSPIHAEVASRQFMEELRELVKNTTNENVKNRILELIQAWAHAFRNEPKYRAIQDIFNLLRVEGFKLQVLKESDAMFIADTAPDWADGDCCHRCRVQFSVVQRKHHCRNCGQIFCSKCSARNSPIPRFGIEKEVRVCEACWDKLNKPSSSSKTNSSNPESSPQQTSQNGVNSGGKSEQELKEEEDLQLAIALSQSEAESKEKHVPPTKSSVQASYNTVLDTNAPSEVNKNCIPSSTDSELDRYLNRSYWEQRQQQQKEETPVQPENRTSPIPSAPVSTSVLQSEPPNYITAKISEKYQNGDMDEMSDFLSNLRTMVEIFVNRLKSNSSRGRPIVNDTYVQSLFINITNMHSQLLKYIQEQDDSRAHYESLQDKLNQVRDARAALDALREEHIEKLRREAEEADRQKQIQMAHKLEIMRKKKQEYLQYQRQLAIQRMQEQEREMQLRQEQIKQQYQVGYQGGTLPSGVVPAQQGPYLPPATQGYPIMHTAIPGNAQGHPNFLPTFRPPQQPTPTNSVSEHPVSAGDFRQPFNMQAMAGAMHSVQPGGPFSQPHVPGNSGVPAHPSSQTPMMVMGPVPQQMHMIPPGIPQQMIQQQNTPVTNVVSIPQGPPVPSVLGNVAPMVPPPSSNQEPPQQQQPQQHVQPAAVPELVSDPLIVFD